MKGSIQSIIDAQEEENEDYLNSQIITYLGNKRSLLSFIGKGLDIIINRLGKDKLKIYDVFSGSGVVSRYFKQYSSKLIVNDLEKYSNVINSCYLSNLSEIKITELMTYYNQIYHELATKPLNQGFITKLYAPKSKNIIKKGERAFYTNRNARYIDTARQLIENIPGKYRKYLLAPLLSEASIHSNTSGVFKGFYKDSLSGVGKFGGTNEDALLRILGDISLPFPIFSNFECEYEIHQGDSNIISSCIENIDVAYIDPPYNQHPYGSNYFMLNLIVDYIEPQLMSEISGIPENWNRSLFNKKAHAFSTFKDLVEKIPAKYLLISFNSEGFISLEEMSTLLKTIGKLQVLETQYNTFRGSRNLRDRNIYVKEYLYLVEKF